MEHRTRARLLAGIGGVTVFLLAFVGASLLLSGGAPLVGLVLGGLAATAIYRRVPG